MDGRKLARGMAWFSLALGAAEIAGARRLSRAFGVGGDALDLAALGSAFRMRGANRGVLGAATGAVAGAMLLDVIAGKKLSGSRA